MKKYTFNWVQTAAVVAILTFASKPIGFLREMLMANYFGTSHVTDAYVMAQSIPTIVFGAVFSSIAIAFVPIFSNTIEEQGLVMGNRFTSSAMNILIIVSTIASIIGLILSDQIVSLFASGFNEETAQLTSFYLKISFFTLIFSSMFGILEDYLKYKGSFFSPVISGYPLNIFLIISVVISAYTNSKFLIFGLLLGTITKFFIDLLFARKKGFKYYLDINANNAISKIVKLSLPVFASSMVSQVALFINKTLASGLKTGSVAALNYGNMLVGMISGLTTGIITTMTYPKLSQAATLKDYSKMNDILSLGVVLNAIISIPITLGSMLYSKQIIHILFERGAFDSTSTQMTATVFFFYSISMFFTTFNGLQWQCFYSMHDTKTPLMLGIIGIILDIVLNISLVGPLASGGLALATSIGAVIMSLISHIALTKKHPEIRMVKSKEKMLKIIIASVIAISISRLAYSAINLFANTSLYFQVLQIGLVVCIAGVIYYFLLRLMKIQELDLLKLIIKK